MKVVIENKFGYLIFLIFFLKQFNPKLDRVALMIIACYAFTIIVKCGVH
jgi:hypothetical protein